MKSNSFELKESPSIYFYMCILCGIILKCWKVVFFPEKVLATLYKLLTKNEQKLYYDGKSRIQLFVPCA